MISIEYTLVLLVKPQWTQDQPRVNQITTIQAVCQQAAMAAPRILHPYDGTSSSSSEEEGLLIQQVADVFTTTASSSDSESTISDEITLQ